MMNNPYTKDFPQLDKVGVYLDTAATSLKPKSVINAVNHYYNNLSSNINRGMYKASVESTMLYEETRERVANFINAKDSEIIFTRGATNSLNTVAYAYGLENLQPGDEIITSELEHHSSFLPMQYIAKKTGAILKFVELSDTGRITVENFKKALTDKTKIVALTYVSNILGYITPIKEIIELAHEKNAVVIVDAAQAVQHIKIDVKELKCDFLAFSGHKMLGPTGIGVLYAKKKHLKNMEPFEYGGDMNDDVNKDVSEWKPGPQKFEAGTMPIASVIGFNEAIKYLEKATLENIHKLVSELHEYAITELNKLEGITIYNPDAETGIITFNIDNVPSHDSIGYLAEKEIDVRAGQHCAKLACDWLGIHSCLRASVYLYNTQNDVDKFVAAVKEATIYFKKLGF